MAKREIVIQLATSEPRLHMWCDRCMTSGGYEVDMYRLTEDGPHSMGTLRGCYRCAHDDG